ncbi:MAG: hypothetical protein ABSE08_11855 [Syntrophobacteraceae bacterium]|jgi:hypothetical protein
MQRCQEQKEGEKKKTDKLSRLWSVINSLIASEFTGYIKLNFTQGSIGRIEKFEEILKK